MLVHDSELKTFEEIVGTDLDNYPGGYKFGGLHLTWDGKERFALELPSEGGLDKVAIRKGIEKLVETDKRVASVLGKQSNLLALEPYLTGSPGKTTQKKVGSSKQFGAQGQEYDQRSAERIDSSSQDPRVAMAGYQEGSKTRSGVKIRQIIGRMNDFIVFLNDKYRVSYEY